MVSIYTFTVEWQGKPRPCTLIKVKGKEITLYFDDHEINRQLGSGMTLYKVDGRVVLPHTVPEENRHIALSIIESVEDTLRKPLLWMF